MCKDILCTHYNIMVELPILLIGYNKKTTYLSNIND